MPHNIKHKWRSIGYKSTIAFDMILLYLRENEHKTTKNTILQEFQWYIVKNIDDFIDKDIEDKKKEKQAQLKREKRKSLHNNTSDGW